MAAGATASIVIFPGIRYERHEEAPQAASEKQDKRQDKTRPRH